MYRLHRVYIRCSVFWDIKTRKPLQIPISQLKIHCTPKIQIKAAKWQNQQNECAPSEDLDQPGHPPSLIRVFAVRMKKVWVKVTVATIIVVNIIQRYFANL